MINVIGIASEMGYIRIPYDTLIDISELDDYPEEETVIITTGSQGEAMAGLSRMADGKHKWIHIKPTDTIVFSSNPIPGNEKAVSKIINELSSRGANIIYQDVHVSGHARREELKLIYSLVCPYYAIPVHGEYRHLRANAQLAHQLGIPRDRILIMQTGDVLEIDRDNAEVTGQVTAGPIFVDGSRIGDISTEVMHDRQRLAEDGVLVAVIALDHETKELRREPVIRSKGFVFIDETDTLIDEAKEFTKEKVEARLAETEYDEESLKKMLRKSLTDFMRKKTGRRPMVFPVIVDLP